MKPFFQLLSLSKLIYYSNFTKLSSSKFSIVATKLIMNEHNQHRLPRDVLPVNYNLTFTPNFDDWTFSGEEIVELTVKNKVDEIVLNAASLVINGAIINNETCPVAYENERLKISLPSTLSPGLAKMHLTFTGTLNDEMKGFYRSTYKTDANEEVRMAVTQFEAADARRAFPCWDEPNIKATFDVNLIVPKTKVALSNMPEKKRTEISDSLVKVEFDRSPIMSTYLLAMVIGDLDFVEAHDTNDVKIRVYSAKGKSNRGNFALDVCRRTLPFYSNYFSTAYPLPKMDLVAIPDFAMGAMENWGLVTYRETLLLVDEKESSAACRQVVALVVGHECAHMWFGNLVTMDWWTDLWLNEGFATWIEYLCVDHCYPEFDIWTTFVTNEHGRALNLDSLKSSHPIQVTVNQPSEIDEIFDTISYAKGASIIRMLNDYLTNDIFKKGLGIYLNRHQYHNAVTTDLWNALSEASGLPVGKIMDTWTNQMGFPVISVDEVQDGHGNTIAITLTQQRFLAHGKADTDQYWIVPVTVCSMNNSHEILLKVLMEPNGNPQTFNLPNPVPGFVRINPGAIAFYHVKYQDSVVPSIISALAENKLEPRERQNLIIDFFSLARAGIIPTTKALDIARSFKLENNYTVWSTLLENVKHITSIVDELDFNLSPLTDRFMIQLTEHIFRKLSWDPTPGESHNDTMLRPIIIRALGRSGHSDVVEEAFKRFNDHHQLSGDSNNVLPADIRSAVYSTILKFGDENHLNKIMELLNRTDLQEEKMRILTSLGSVPFSMLPRIHRFAFSDEVRKQDKYCVILSTVTNAKSRALLWNLVKSDWEELKSQIPNNHMLGILIKAAFKDFIKQDQHDELKMFFTENRCQVVRPIDQTLENIKINELQLMRDGDDLKSFFSQY